MNDRLEVESMSSDRLTDRVAALPLWKRTMDVGGASIALLLLSPLMVLIAVAIKLVSPGPIFYRQDRIGFRGETFSCFKFRSMQPETETDIHRSHLEHLISSSEPMTKLDKKNDPRLIPFGRQLRAAALDELPQLFNILRGDMSLVGPRPCIPYEYEKYNDVQKRRVMAVPGLTGLWQVSGKNRTTFDEMVDFDIQYAYRKSVWLDLWIIVRTPAVVITQLLSLTHKKQAQSQEYASREAS